MTESDADLVALARGGDPQAFAALVRRYQRQAWALARATVGDAAEAEDLAQEAFVRAFRNLDLLADPARFGGWLRRIVFGVSIDWLRTFQPALFRGDDAFAAEIDGVAANEPTPLERLERLELVSRVSCAVASLPPRYRTPLVLFHLDGLSHRRVAEALGVTESSARSLVSRARRKLEPLLRDAGRETVTIDEVFEPQRADPPRRFLHVLNGDATRLKLERSAVPGTFAVWADVLHEGPCRIVPQEQWRRMRSRYLAGQGFLPEREVLSTYERWDAQLAAYAAYEEVVLWFEHDLFDQLLLVRHLHWLASLGPQPDTTFSLICIGAFPGVPDFIGLGPLTPDQLGSLLDTRHMITEAEIRLGARTWERFCAPDPSRLAALRAEDTSALPFLDGALRRFLEDYPARADGLSRSERQILVAIDQGARTPVEVFRATQSMEERVFMGDWSWWSIARALASARTPLIRMETGPMTGALPDGRLELTEAGHGVLAGRLDHVALNGIDRWMGGVQLTDGRWRWTGETLQDTA